MCVNKSLYYCLLLLWLLCGLRCVVSATGGLNIFYGCIYVGESFGKGWLDYRLSSWNAVPNGWSSEVQHIDLSENQIQSLPANVFKQAGLANLINLCMEKCEIKEIDEQAFSGLSLLKSLDLRHNKIRTIHPNIFRETTNLVSLSMDGNPIEVLEDGLFTDLKFLKTVRLDDCKIRQIGLKTFDQVPVLSMISLVNNRLAQINALSTMALSGLKSLYILENPWNCNCRLKDVRDWFVSRFGSDNVPQCEQPRHLHGERWDEIESSQFNCTPYVLHLPGNETVTAAGENVTLSCTAFGDLLPEMYWKTPFGDKLTFDVNSTKYSITESKTAENNQSVLNLTISNIQTDDAGTYACVADNFKSEDEHYAFYTKLKIRHSESSNTIIVTSKNPITQNNIFVANTTAKIDEIITKSSRTSL